MGKNHKKRSGATYSTVKKEGLKSTGTTIVNAWNFSKSRGLITAKVGVYKNSRVFIGKEEGNKYQTMIAEVNYTRSGITKIIPCCMNVSTKVIGLQDIGMCISPKGSGKTSSGKHVKGYFGTYTQRDND